MDPPIQILSVSTLFLTVLYPKWEDAAKFVVFTRFLSHDSAGRWQSSTPQNYQRTARGLMRTPSNASNETPECEPRHSSRQVSCGSVYRYSKGINAEQDRQVSWQSYHSTNCSFRTCFPLEKHTSIPPQQYALPPPVNQKSHREFLFSFPSNLLSIASL